MMDLNLLRLVPILAKEKNVTRAARKANITQSAFSHALNRLREQLNDEMFGTDPLCGVDDPGD